MALVTLALTVFDSDGTESQVTLYTTDEFSIGTLIHAVLDLVPIIGAMIGGGLRPIATISITVDLTDSGDYATYDTALSTSDIEEGLYYQYNTDGSISIRSGRIPTILETLFITGTRNVNPANVAWAAFNTAMLSGLSTTDENDDPITLLFKDRYGNDLLTLRDAYEQFQSSRSRS